MLERRRIFQKTHLILNDVTGRRSGAKNDEKEDAGSSLTGQQGIKRKNGKREAAVASEFKFLSAKSRVWTRL